MTGLASTILHPSLLDRWTLLIVARLVRLWTINNDLFLLLLKRTRLKRLTLP